MILSQEKINENVAKLIEAPTNENLWTFILDLQDYFKFRIKKFAKGNKFIEIDELLNIINLMLFERWRKQLDKGEFMMNKIYGYCAVVVDGQCIHYLNEKNKELSYEEITEEKNG